MCGRFTNRLTWREIVALYHLTAPAEPARNLPARYNICPTTTMDAVIDRNAQRELVPMRWGLVPSWWKKTAKETPSTFNARAETVAAWHSQLLPVEAAKPWPLDLNLAAVEADLALSFP